MSKDRHHACRLSRVPLLLVVTSLITLTAAVGAAAGAPTVSGLPWRSGATKGGDCLATLRGRPHDVLASYLPKGSFAFMTAASGELAGTGLAAQAPLWVVSVPLLTDSTAGQFSACAAGAFDRYWRQIGANLRRAGARTTIVRLGWEANSGSHAWGVTSPGQVPAYRACWRHAAAQLKATAPAVLLDWTNSKRTPNTAIHVLPLHMGDVAMYPGDDVVDLWGVHYYDSGPKMSTQALWDAAYTRTSGGEPWGLGTWLQAAKDHGKLLGIGEWGVWRHPGQTATVADDPVYIDNMHRFFAVQAANVAYETYFNADPPDGEHALCPGAPFPRALATYKAAWGGGSRRPRRRNPRPCRGVGRASSSRRVGRTVSLGLALAASAAPACAGTTERASVGPGGAQADGRSSGVALSPDGRYVAFASFAANLAPGSTNGRHNIYLRDRSAGATERVSVGPGGAAGNDSSFDAAVSADGLLVAFGSYATNLVPGDDNMRPDIFARDRGAGATERANVAPDGAQANDDSDSPGLSADGRFLAFRSAATNLVAGDTNLYGDVFVRDRRAGTTERVSVSSGGAEGDANSYRPVISADGQFVAFVSDATNLVPGDTNGHADVFVRDLAAGRTERVSLGPGGAQGNGDSGYVGLAISGDGRLRRFRLGRQQPGPGRHQRPRGRVRARPPGGHYRAGEPRAGWRPR